MTVDFAALVAGDKVAWIRGDGYGGPWRAVRFGAVLRVLKTRTVVRFGAEDVAWRSADQRYGAGRSTMGRWALGRVERLVTVDEGRAIAAIINDRLSAVKRVADANLAALVERGRNVRDADDVRALAAALRAAADVLEGR